MRYPSQRVAYPYFVVALLLFGLQVAFGLLAAAKYLGPDPLLNLLPFDVVKAIHTNLLLVWLLTGFGFLRHGESWLGVTASRPSSFARARWSNPRGSRECPRTRRSFLGARRSGG